MIVPIFGRGYSVHSILYSQIQHLIMAENVKNVKAETKLFKNDLPYANKVIYNYPSTGMYELIILGILTMCLCLDELALRKSGVDLFKNVIKFYHNVDCAIEHID